MRKTALLYDKNESIFNWTIKNPKQDTFLAKFKSRNEAIEYLITKNEEIYIDVFNKKGFIEGEIVIFHNEKNNKILLIPNTMDNDNGQYEDFCAEFGIDYLTFAKSDDLNEIRRKLHNIKFIEGDSFDKWFLTQTEIIRKDKKYYISGYANDKILRNELDKLLKFEQIIENKSKKIEKIKNNRNNKNNVSFFIDTKEVNNNSKKENNLKKNDTLIDFNPENSETIILDKEFLNEKNNIDVQHKKQKNKKSRITVAIFSIFLILLILSIIALGIIWYINPDLFIVTK
ncbi:Uncharacterised protein [Mycoplasmopsis maculosa]|uniref:Uncharacterized protein n=1 Tax=Mycoplasmopsis maculosa TaxID=114885 RepID=A0A449B3S9_9BACT|nr:hypothetical protein [Mycoplasmopsis maculosa]VEU75247.1 Uncharacterised protein [Mycoplasmopsis maculosa]